MRQSLLVISLCAALACFGQDSSNTVTIPQDTAVYKISSIAIVEMRIQEQKLLFSNEILKVKPAASFDKLLQMQSGIFIKSQGVGTLSTPSYKGLGSAHIPVIINGYSIQSSMNVNTDLSLISTFHFDMAEFQEVGLDKTVATNLGPSLDIRSSSKNRNELLLNTNSLGLKTLGYAYSKGLKKGRLTVSAISQQSPNRINLRIYGRDSLLSNTRYAISSLNFKLSTLFSRHIAHTVTAFMQYSDRQIPSSLYTMNDGVQKDFNIMLGNKLSYDKFKNVLVVFDNQLWEENIEYSSAARNHLTKNKVFNTNTNLQIQAYSIKSKIIDRLDFGIFHSFNNYTSEAIQSRVLRSILRLNAKVAKQYNKGYVAFTPAAIFSENEFNYSAFIKWLHNLGKSQSVKLEAQKVLRLPSLNERYWYEPGFALGNANLEAESGYRLDAYYLLAKEQFYISINPFIAYYDNLIMWVGYPVIQATNVQKVFSRGAVFNFNKSFKFKKGVFSINHNQHWVWSTYADTSSKYSPYGKQLIFTPVLNANITLTYSIGKSGFYINQLYTGKNYYSSDNSAYLGPYTIMDIGAFKEFKRLKVSASINNVFNSAYFSIPNQPLAGINAEINLNIYLNKKTK